MPSLPSGACPLAELTGGFHCPREISQLDRMRLVNARRMTAMDFVIVAVALAFGYWGYGHGLIVGALTLTGFAAGAFLQQAGAVAARGRLRVGLRACDRARRGAAARGDRRDFVEGGAQRLRWRFVLGGRRRALDGAGGVALFCAALALRRHGCSGRSPCTRPALAICAPPSSDHRLCASAHHQDATKESERTHAAAGARA